MPDVTTGDLALPIPLDSDPLELMPDTIRELAYQLELNVKPPGIGFSWTWTAANANPALGNGVSRGIYYRLGQDLIRAYYWLMAGTTTTFGNGVFRFTLPFPALEVTGSDATTVVIQQSGYGMAYDDSAGARYEAVPYVMASDNETLEVRTRPTVAGDPMRTVASASPFTWANKDRLYLCLEYQTDGS